MLQIPVSPTPWPFWRRLLFRFSFLFFALVAAPWTWANIVPGIDWLVDKYNDVIDWLVNAANQHILHIRPVLVPLNGSGDTSFGWASLWAFCGIALIGVLIWSFLDRRRKTYVQLNYWLCLMLRYYLSLTALNYGIAKLFLTQMPFPDTSELATPLGDFLPMRLSWMFIGYSGPYQFFSGLMECIAGLLLLYRRTATLGTLFAAGIFVNVAMLNLAYDIPVKIFSIEMVAICFFLLANEWKRISCFFILGRPADACSIYQYPLQQRWMRIGRAVLKVCFLVLAIGVSTWQTADLRAYYTRISPEPVMPGLYNVTAHRVNGAAVTAADQRYWKDIVFDGKRSGSMATSDTCFKERYGRRYFVYDVDTTNRTIALRHVADGSIVTTLNYTMPNASGIELSGMYKGDTLRVSLQRSTHHYQLTDRPFHWISEANR